MQTAQMVHLVTAALFVSHVALGQEDAETAIRHRVKQYETAYNAGDADGVASVYAVDGSHTYALGNTDRGRSQIAKGLRAQLAGPLKGSRIVLTPTRIRPLSPDVAIEEASFSLSGLKAAGGTFLPPVGGLCLAIYQRRNEQWFAAAVQCMVPPPAPQPQ